MASERQYIDLIELSEKLDNDLKRGYKIKPVDLFKMHTTKKGLPFYFPLEAIDQGGKLSILNPKGDWVQIYPSDELTEIEREAKIYGLEDYYKRCKEIRELSHGKELTLIKYKPTPHSSEKMKAYIGKGSFKRDWSRRSLTDKEEQTIWVQFPAGLVFVDEMLCYLKGSSYPVHEPPSARFNMETKIIRKPNPNLTAINPIAVSCENVFVDIDELEAHFNKDNETDLNVDYENKTTPVKGVPETTKERILEELRECGLSPHERLPHGKITELTKIIEENSNPSIKVGTTLKIIKEMKIRSVHQTIK